MLGVRLSHRRSDQQSSSHWMWFAVPKSYLPGELATLPRGNSNRSTVPPGAPPAGRGSGDSCPHAIKRTLTVKLRKTFDQLGWPAWGAVLWALPPLRPKHC